MEKTFEENALPGEAPPVGAAPAGVSGVPAEPPAGAVQRLEQQLREAQDRHLRLAAEFDNFRKRVARERLRAFYPAPRPSRLEAVLLVDKKLRKELEGAGLERIDPVGQPFDPALHEAVSVLPAPAPELDHTVAATFQVGYRFKGSLVRPARVQVYSAEGHA